MAVTNLELGEAVVELLNEEEPVEEVVDSLLVVVLIEISLVVVMLDDTEDEVEVEASELVV